MKLEKALMQLEEEELFGKVHSIDIEQSEIMKNFGTLANIIQEAMKQGRTFVSNKIEQ